MDKYEFNIKVEQIKKMVNKEDFATAMKIADTIDWRRVRNANLLSTISQVYEKNEEYQEAKEVLLLAFERAPIGKRYLYKLTELALKEGSAREAEDYYREFCELAPEDTRQYILRYLILREKNASEDQLIQALERYINAELDEKWMYELAELYARAGRGEDCVRLCDKMILMFGIGTYVEKATELKKRYAPLNNYQRKPLQNRSSYNGSIIQMPGTSDYNGNWQEPGSNYGAGTEGYGANNNFGTGYGSDNGYAAGAGYGSEEGYGAEQSYGPVGSYGAGYGTQGSYGLGAGYGSENSYGTEAGYGTQNNYGAGPEYGTQNNYGAGPEYGAQNNYGAGPEYSPQNNYTAGPEYGPQNNYTAGPEYGPQNNYGADAGYGAQNNYPVGAEYGSQNNYGTGTEFSAQKSYETEPGYDTGRSYGAGAGYISGNGYRAEPGNDSGNSYETGTGYDTGNSYGAGASYGSDSSYEEGAGYGARNGYGAGTVYNTGNNYAAEPDYNMGNSYAAEQGYGAGNGYGAPLTADNRYGVNTAYSMDSQGRPVYGGTNNYRDTSVNGAQEPYENNAVYHTGNIYEADESYYAGDGYENNQPYGAGSGYGGDAGYGVPDGYPGNTYVPQDSYDRNGGNYDADTKTSYSTGRDYRDNMVYEPDNGYGRNEAYETGPSYDSGAWPGAEEEMRSQKPAGYGGREYSYPHSHSGYPPAGPYVVDEELMANLHQAAAEKELAAEMSRISTEEYVEPEPEFNQTRVFRGKNNIRVLRPRMEEEEKPFYHRSYTPHHMIIEARTAQEGLKTAVEELKKVHQETGVNNSVIKISGSKLSRRGVINVSDKLAGKDLIVEEAGDLNQRDLEELQMLLERDETGMIVVLIDNPLQMEELHQQNPGFINLFKCINLEKVIEEPAQAAAEENWGQEEPYYQEEAELSELRPEAESEQSSQLEQVPEITPGPESEPEPKSEIQSEPETELEPESEPEPELENETENGIQSEPEPKLDTKAQAESDSEEEPEPELQPEQQDALNPISSGEPEPQYDDLDEEELAREEDLEESSELDNEFYDSDDYEEEYPENDYLEEDEYRDAGPAEDEYDEVYDEYYEEEEAYNDEEYEDPEPVDEDEELGIDAFTDYAVQYASEIDCSITGKSLLALCQHVEAMEENGIPLTRANAEDMIEEAADKAEKPSLGGLIKGVFSSKYDKEGLLILKEEHFS